MIQQLLNQLGFTDKEAKIYIAILEQGKIAPAHLADLTGINRTTVYSIAEQLIDRGIITEDLGGSASQLVALPPKELESLIRKEEKALKDKRQLIDKAVDELQTIAKATKYSVPKIVFIDEEHLEDYLYKQTPVWNKSLEQSDGVWWGWQSGDFVENYQSWIDWYWQEANPPHISLKLLSNQSESESQVARKQYERRQIKFWEKSSGFSSTTWISGDYVIMINTHTRPHFLVEIHDKTLAHNMRELFKGIWETI